MYRWDITGIIFMKNFYIILFLTININAFASEFKTSQITRELFNLEQTCSFSLKYTTVDIWSEASTPNNPFPATWVYATVLVNCKQEKDSYVTVNVYHNGKHVGTGVVVIPAGSLSSEETRIDVDVRSTGRGPATLKLN